jgi:hypothetical protein
MNFKYIPDAGYSDEEDKSRKCLCYDFTAQNYKLLVMQVRLMLDYQKELENRIKNLEKKTK